MADSNSSSDRKPDSKEVRSGQALTSAPVEWLRWPEVWLFLALSAVDLVLTYVLIGHFGHQEGNPVARYFVEGWGLKGMVWFKLGLVSIILTISHVVALRQPDQARLVVRLGLLSVAAVVVYSAGLLLKAM